MKNKHIAVFLVSIGFSFLAGCSNLSEGQQKTLAQFEQVAAEVAPLVASYAETGQINYAQAIPVAVNSLAIFAPGDTVDTADLSQKIRDAIAAFTDGSGKSTGQKIAAVVLKLLPANPTGAEVNAALIQAGIGASSGANPI